MSKLDGVGSYFQPRTQGGPSEPSGAPELYGTPGGGKGSLAAVSLSFDGPPRNYLEPLGLHELSADQRDRLLDTYREMSERLAESFPAGSLDNFFLPAINRLSFGRYDHDGDPLPSAGADATERPSAVRRR